MRTRPPRRPGKPAKQGGLAHGSETITAEKQVYPRQPRNPGPERVSASKEAPVALLDREDKSATVIAFPEPKGRRRRRWWLAAAISAVLLSTLR